MSLPRNMTQEEWKVFMPEVPYREFCEDKATVFVPENQQV
jgi:hypothetical protein